MSRTIITAIASFFQEMRSGFFWQAMPGTSLYSTSKRVTPGPYGHSAYNVAAVSMLRSLFHTSHFNNFTLHIDSENKNDLTVHIMTNDHHLFHNEAETQLHDKLLKAQQALTAQFQDSHTFHQDGQEMIAFPKLNSTQMSTHGLGIVKYFLYETTAGSLRVQLCPNVHGAYPHQDHPALIEKLGYLSPTNKIPHPNYYVLMHPADLTSTNIIHRGLIRPSTENIIPPAGEKPTLVSSSLKLG